jgi:hypothetical protein
VISGKPEGKEQDVITCLCAIGERTFAQKRVIVKAVHRTLYEE